MSLYLLPFIAASIGWFTNYIAVKMLFHPRREINLYVFKIHGIFPKRKAILARNLASTVASELISIPEILEMTNQKDSEKDLKKKIAAAVDDYLNNKLPDQLNPLMAVFLTEKRISKIKKSIITEIEFILEDVKLYFEDQFAQIDIEDFIEQKILAFPNEKLESVLMSVMKKELRYIEVVGAIIGFVIGIIQILLVKYT